MKSPGSVLIVVLGLLAILAIIGITFVTMSNLDRRTATNFAVQSQFMLAAEGAVDYVCHHLVQDLWAYNTLEESQAEEPGASHRHQYYSDCLLTDHNRPTVLKSENVGLLRNEPFDYPDKAYDPWLSSPINPTTGALFSNDGYAAHFSYGYQRAYRRVGKPAGFETPLGPYGLRDWGIDTDPQLRPNNLGFPAPGQGGTVMVPRYTYDIPGNSTGHGVWNPDLSFPFQTGLIRVSVTVLDHGRMMHLNAHGNKNQANERKGYYISDVDPSNLFGGGSGPGGGGLPNSFFSPSGTPTGLWAEADHPGNRIQKQVVIENPGRYGDHPFTLDEEFELRRLTGTYFYSRIEQLVTNLGSAPGATTQQAAGNRLNLTTVGWTAEVRPSFDRETGEVAEPRFLENGYEWRKTDLNLDLAKYVKRTLEELDLFDDEQQLNQFASNICAFRDGTPRENESLLRSYFGKKGASRQPVIEKMEVEFTREEEKKDDEGNVEEINQWWEITVWLRNPWRRLYVGASEKGLPLEGISLRANTGDTGTVQEDFGELESMSGADRLQWKERTKEATCTIKNTIDNPPNAEQERLASALRSISLLYKKTTIDRIDKDYIEQAGNGLKEGDNRTLERGITFRPEGATINGNDVLVVYIFLDRNDDGEPVWFEGNGAHTLPADAVPIRFPKSVKAYTDEDIPVGGLPPEWIDGVSDGTGGGGAGGDGGAVGFRAFPRVGDLNQVLCRFPRPGEEVEGEDDEHFWPWVPRVAQATADDEKYVKFSWNWKPEEDDGDDDGNGADEVKRLEAANRFTVGGPWLDRIDNDGDGFADATLPDDEDGDDQTTETFRGRDFGRDFIEGGEGINLSDSGGRFGGSEIRVAGKINLNTAGRKVLEALGQSFGMDGKEFADCVTDLRSTSPIESPAEIVKGLTEMSVYNTLFKKSKEDLHAMGARGNVEISDLPYTLISNIATVRSDTYSIYGTVQYIDVQAMHDAGADVDARKAAVRRSRRFWALVDRSPCAAHRPISVSVVLDSGFIRPRVLNFQWLD